MEQGLKATPSASGDTCLSPPGVRSGSMVLKKSLPKFRVAESKKNRPPQPRSDDLNVEFCKASNCRGRRDAKFGRPFVKPELFNTIGRKLAFLHAHTAASYQPLNVVHRRAPLGEVTPNFRRLDGLSR